MNEGQAVPQVSRPLAHESTHEANGSDALPWTTIHGRGATGSKPSASSVNAGYLYHDTTLNQLERSNGTTWDVLSGNATPGGSDKAIQYNNASTLGGISPGAAGTVLASNGATSTPSFQEISSIVNSMMSGSGVPSAGLGIDGDFYIDTTNWNLHGPKASGTWPAGVKFIAPGGGATILNETRESATTAWAITLPVACKRIRISLTLINPINASNIISLSVNGTSTGHFEQLYGVDGATVGAGEATSPRLPDSPNLSYTDYCIEMSVVSGVETSVVCSANARNSTTSLAALASCARISQSADISTITFTGNQTSGIGIGSHIIIERVDNVVGSTSVATLAENTFTGAQTVQAAAGQDAIKIAGRAGGTSSYSVTITPLALSANRTHSHPDEDGTYALRGANTFTGIQTIDLGSGSLPTELAAAVMRIAQADGNSPRVEFLSWGANAVSWRGRAHGGTRAAPTATTDGLSFHQFGCFGHDGNGYVAGQKALFSILADGLWSASNTGTYYTWTGTSNGSTTNTTWMMLRNGVLSLTNTTEATDKDTGSIVTEGGIGVEKSVFAGGDVTAVGAVYIGGNATDGSWRMTISGTSLVVQRRESGVWVTKQTVEA